MSFRPTGRPRSGERAQRVGILARMRARVVDIEIGERADLVLARRDGRRAEIDHALRRDLARLDAARKIEGGEERTVAAFQHCKIPGLECTVARMTRK